MANSPGRLATSEELIQKLYHYSTKHPVTGCLEWQRCKIPAGYGQISIGKQKQAYAHRVSYTVFKGDIPKGMLVCHSCDNPSCVNPEHLFLGTYADNSQDCSRKMRNRTSRSRGVTNPKAKLTETDVLAIRESTASKKDLAAQFNVSCVMIGYIINRKNWRHV